MRFLESIDETTVPLVALDAHRYGNQVEIRFETIAGATYGLEAKPSLTSTWAPISPVIQGTGGLTNITLNIDSSVQFLRLVKAP